MKGEDHSKKPLSKIDTAWLRMDDPTNQMMITVVMLFKEPLDFELVRTAIEERLLHHSRFVQRVGGPLLPLGSPRWEPDPHFDLRAHLHRVALPAPGDEAALRDLVSDLMSTALDHQKPLWQVHLVERFEGGSAFVMRLHHCIGDGMSLVEVFRGLSDAGAAAGNGEKRPRRHRHLVGRAALLGNVVHVASEALKRAVDAWHEPEHARHLAHQGAAAASALGKLLLMPHDVKTRLRGQLGAVKRVAWSEAIVLTDIKAVGKALGATVNDIIASAVAGALHRYLHSHGDFHEGLDIRAMLPVNLRSEQDRELRNEFGLIFLPLPLEVEDPLARLREVKQRLDDLKRSPEAVIALGILAALGVASADMEKLAVEMFAKKATLLLTNVPGPRTKFSLAGRQAHAVLAWAPQAGAMGLGFSVVSFGGEIRVGVGADAGLVPDPEALVAFFHEELEALRALMREGMDESAKREVVESTPQ